MRPQLTDKTITVWGLLRPRLVNLLKTMFSHGKLHTEKISFSNLATKRHSIFIRHLDCGSCNGCELELNALNNPIYDLERFRIQFEASPRHADALVMTGPFTRNLEEAAGLTFEAMSEPRQIVTIGDCAKDGGIFKDSYAVTNRPPEIEAIIQATNIHAAGCPPTPEDILKALAKLSTVMST